MEVALVFATLIASGLAAQQADSINSCIQYVPGDFNMIISAPHGGTFDVPNCPQRQPGCKNPDGTCYFNSSPSVTCARDNVTCTYRFEPDTYTQEIAAMVVQNIQNNLGKRPHLITMNCTRATLDVNREINEAAQGCANAETVYNSYHGKISSVISTFTQTKNLLFDIHGQAHKQNRTELGYGVDKSVFDTVAASSTHTFPKGALSQTTIGALRARLEAGGAVTDYDLYFGKNSMGFFLESAGFGAIPGPTYPIAGFTDYKYFDGGYTVQNHSSSTLDAIQMEGPGEVRIDGGPTMRAAYASALADAITRFYKAYYI